MKKLSVISAVAALTLCTGHLSASEPVNSGTQGKTLYVIGDSYVKNHMRPISETWHSKAAARLGMDYHNLGINGNCIAFDRTDRGFGVPMTRRYSEMPSDADYILVIAGHNDAVMADTDLKFHNFTDSLDCLCSRLKESYPHARIGFVTPWAVDRKNFSEVIDLIKTTAARYGFPVLDMAYTAGIKVNDPDFRAVYFQNKGVDDTAHLNSAGHDLLVDYGTAFLLLLSAQPR